MLLIAPTGFSAALLVHKQTVFANKWGEQFVQMWNCNRVFCLPLGVFEKLAQRCYSCDRLIDQDPGASSDWSEFSGSLNLIGPDPVGGCC